MQFGLTEEQEMIVSTVRSFVETEIYPLEDEVEKSGHVPAEMGKAIRDKVMSSPFDPFGGKAEVGHYVFEHRFLVEAGRRRCW